MSIDTTVAQSARIWNYLLGGSDHYEVDREVGDRFRREFPGIIDVARGGRKFQARAIRCIASEGMVTQFLDIGAGLPAADNTHQIAQRENPSSRIVYVDKDPLVLAHARELLTSTPEGATAYVNADLRDAEAVLGEAAKTLDLDQPVAVLFMGVLGHIVDDDEARAVVRQLLEPLAPGSFLALQDGTATSTATIEAHRGYNSSGTLQYQLRSPQQIEELFDGLDLLPPGIASITQWRENGEHVDAYGGVARKPDRRSLS